MHIRQADNKIFNTLPKSYRLADGRVITGFDKLTDSERIALASIYPIVGEPILLPWQSKENPVYSFTATGATVSYTVTDLSLEAYKQQRVSEVYTACKTILDSNSDWYAQVEIAQFPALQAEVTQYNVDGTVGSSMQTVISRGRHTAATLSLLLTPKIAIQNAALAARDTHVAAILALTTHQAVADYDITTNWS